jgi:hypothetical protein
MTPNGTRPIIPAARFSRPGDAVDSSGKQADEFRRAARRADRLNLARRSNRSERGRAAEPLQPGFDHDDLVVESPDRIAEIESVGLLDEQLTLEPLTMLAHLLERFTIFQGHIRIDNQLHRNRHDATPPTRRQKNSIEMGLDTRNRIINSLWITAESASLAHQCAGGFSGIRMTDSKNRREQPPMNRRQLLKTAAALPLVQAVWTRAAPAQTGYPTRNITMIVPFPAGGQADLAARPVALALERVLGKSVIVDNRAGGAGGSIGNAQAARPSRTATRC